MIDRLYSKAQTMKKNGKSAWKYVYKINKLIVNIAYPIAQLFNNRYGLDDNSDVVVSLTTYPARIKTVWITIASLLNQTYKPRKVILYLAKEQFEDGHNGLPKRLIALEKRGLDIRFVDGDLKPHKKYYYALQDYPQMRVITADDDIFYPENHIANLVAGANRFPDSVICARSHRITVDNATNDFKPYNTWKEELKEKPDILTIPIGCNGVLYKRSFFDDELFDVGKINKFTLYTDDLWLKIMEVKSGTPVFNCIDEPLIYFDNIFNGNTGLWHTNTDDSAENRNDRVWSILMDAYPEVKEKLIRNEGIL